MLETFGMQQGGSQHRRLIEAFQRVFGATIFFGTDTQLKAAPVFHQVRFNFMSEARIWYGRNFDQPNLPDDCQNMIVLSGSHVASHSHRSASRQGSIVRARRLGPLYLALVSLLHGQGRRADSALWHWPNSGTRA